MKLTVRDRDGHRQLLFMLSVGSAHRTACSLLPVRYADRSALTMRPSRELPRDQFVAWVLDDITPLL